MYIDINTLYVYNMFYRVLISLKLYSIHCILYNVYIIINKTTIYVYLRFRIKNFLIVKVGSSVRKRGKIY